MHLMQMFVYGLTGGALGLLPVLLFLRAPIIPALRTYSWAYLAAFAIVALPSLAFGQDLPDVGQLVPFLPPSYAVAVTKGLALWQLVGVFAGLMARGGVIVNGKTSGSGSGWYKFWNAVATFPGHKTAPATAPDVGGAG